VTTLWGMLGPKYPNRSKTEEYLRKIAKDKKMYTRFVNA
jgi:hypothetical protein